MSNKIVIHVHECLRQTVTMLKHGALFIAEPGETGWGYFTGDDITATGNIHERINKAGDVPDVVISIAGGDGDEIIMTKKGDHVLTLGPDQEWSVVEHGIDTLLSFGRGMRTRALVDNIEVIPVEHDYSPVMHFNTLEDMLPSGDPEGLEITLGDFVDFIKVSGGIPQEGLTTLHSPQNYKFISTVINDKTIAEIKPDSICVIEYELDDGSGVFCNLDGTISRGLSNGVGKIESWIPIEEIGLGDGVVAKITAMLST